MSSTMAGRRRRNASPDLSRLAGLQSAIVDGAASPLVVAGLSAWSRVLSAVVAARPRAQVVPGGNNAAVVTGIEPTDQLIQVTRLSAGQLSTVAGGNNTAAVPGINAGDRLIRVTRVNVAGAPAPHADLPGCAISGAGTISLGGLNETGNDLQVEWEAAAVDAVGAAVTGSGAINLGGNNWTGFQVQVFWTRPEYALVPGTAAANSLPYTGAVGALAAADKVTVTWAASLE